MHFSFLFGLFALPVLARLAPDVTRTTRSWGSSEADSHSPFKRLLTANICATANLAIQENVYTCVPRIGGGQTCTVTATIPVSLGANVCVCLSDGQLTQATKDLITQIVNSQANRALVATLTALTGGQQQFANAGAIVTFLENEVLNVVGGQTTQCDYPTGSVPDSCTSCHSTCPTGTYLCGDACIDNSLGCSSGLPVPLKRRRRDFLLGADVKCPAHLTACGIPSTSFFTGRNFECIDTSSNLESCGACAFPLPGQPMGTDCTAIPHTMNVACLWGRCIIESCERGYELNVEASACVPATKQSVFGRMWDGKQAIKARQVKAADLRKKAMA